MSREQTSNIVYISGKFLDRREEIRAAFEKHDLVELRAKDGSIELAIQLAEHFVKKGWATYEQFRSSLTANQDGDSIPQVLIKLNYRPADPPVQEKAPEKKEYRQRERDTRDYNDKYEQRSEQRYERRDRGSKLNTNNRD